MAIYRHVQVSFWTDAKVSEEMTPEDKLFYLYLLTNSSTTQIGIYQITKKKMAFDLGYSIETIQNLMDRFERYHELIKYNLNTREIAILNWGRYNFNRAGKPVEDCVKKELQGVKDKSLVQHVVHNIKNGRIRDLFLAIMSKAKKEIVHTDEILELEKLIYEPSDIPQYEPYDDMACLGNQSERDSSNQDIEQFSAQGEHVHEKVEQNEQLVHEADEARFYAEFNDTSTIRGTVRNTIRGQKEKEKQKEKELKDKDQPCGRSNVYPEGFENFWSLYPRRLGKKRSFSLWERRIKQDTTQKDLLLAAKNYAEYCEEKKLDPEYIKHPSTFLSNKLDYEDWITPPVKPEQVYKKPKDYAEIRMQQDMAYLTYLYGEEVCACSP